MDSSPEITDQAAQLRALDVLAEQHRRITALSSLVGPEKRRTLDAAIGLSWRAPSRAEFDTRVAELGDHLVAVEVHLRDALDECERARATVLAGLPTGATVSADPGGHRGDLAATGLPAASLAAE